MQSTSFGLSYILRGGFMMYPLIFSALIALTVIIERFVMIYFRYSGDKDLAARTLQTLKSPNQQTDQQAVAYRALQGSTGPVASVLEAGLREATAPLVEIEQSMQNRAEMWVPILEKRLDILDTIITAAPLMGLLGTITGMMASFQVLSDKGVNEPNAITGGVAEALIATATGLVIALVSLVAYNYFNNKVKTIIFEMESAGAQILEAKRTQLRTGR